MNQTKLEPMKEKIMKKELKNTLKPLKLLMNVYNSFHHLKTHPLLKSRMSKLPLRKLKAKFHTNLNGPPLLKHSLLLQQNKTSQIKEELRRLFLL